MIKTNSLELLIISAMENHRQELRDTIKKLDADIERLLEMLTIEQRADFMNATECEG